MLKERWGAPVGAEFCEFLNVTSCEVTEKHKSFTFGFYNPSGWTYLHPFRIPLANPSSYVLEGSFDLVSWDLVPISETKKLLNNDLRKVSIRKIKCTLTRSRHKKKQILDSSFSVEKK